jgi:hypothetical protein
MKKKQVKPEKSLNQIKIEDGYQDMNLKSKKIKKSRTKVSSPRYEEYILEDEATDALNKLQDNVEINKKKITCLQDENNKLKIMLDRLEDIVKTFYLEIHNLRQGLAALSTQLQYQNGYNQNFMQCNQGGFQEGLKQEFGEEQSLLQYNVQYQNLYTQSNNQQNLQTTDSLLEKENIISSQLNDLPLAKIEDCNESSWQGFYLNSKMQREGIGSQK